MKERMFGNLKETNAYHITKQAFTTHSRYETIGNFQIAIRIWSIV
jgi:hypothetical protein